MGINQITKSIINSGAEIHTRLGPGLLESAYRECLHYELTRQGYFVEREKPMPIIYNDVKLEHGYRLDLLVERAVVIEIKTVDALAKVHFEQVLTYLKLGDFRVGLLMNFHVSSLMDGLRRIVNKFDDKTA